MTSSFLLPFSDSAVVYRNEHHIGEALKTLLPKYSLQRADLFITTKLSEFFPVHKSRSNEEKVVVWRVEGSDS
jgi:diketogulonate reductase-like aldo/keto reductase